MGSIPIATKFLSANLLRKQLLTSTPHSFSFRQFYVARPNFIFVSQVSKKPEKPECDPFGLNDEVEQGNTLVQGFYRRDSSAASKSIVTVSVEEKRSKEPESNSRLEKYNEWIENKRESKKNLNDETILQADFGTIRRDGDNLIKVDGQFDLESSNDRRKSRRRPVQRQQPISMAEPEIKNSAYEFVQNHRTKKYEEEAALKKPKDKVIDPRNSQNFSVEDDYDTNNNHRQREDSLADMDSFVIPKVYIMQNLNNLTHKDMWSLLKKTIVFENKFLFGINKPYGISIHSSTQECRHKIIDFLPEFALHFRCENIYPLHRLDKDTTGVLLFAKDKKLGNIIIEKFSQQQIQKVYIAITKKCPEILEGTVKIPIGEGKVSGTKIYRSVLKPDLSQYQIPSKQKDCREAITKFRVIHSNPDCAFVELQPETGLKHQIRVHLGLGLACPILGDHKYSHRDKLAPQRLPSGMLMRLRVKQTKVRELPLHLHSSSVQFTLPPEYTESKEPVFIHARPPYFFMHSLRVLGLKT